MIPQSASPCVYPEDIECVLDPVDSRGGIFISNVEAASNLLTLRRHNIKAILTAAFNINLTHQKSDIPLYLHVPGQDHEKFDLSCYFEEAVAFIRKALETTNILVHCMAGVSRSVTLVLAYLIKFKGMSFDEAFAVVKRRRRIIHPNQGFVDQLKLYEKQCNRVPHRDWKESTVRLSSPGKRSAPLSREVEQILKKYESKLDYSQKNTNMRQSTSRIPYDSPSKTAYDSPSKIVYEPPSRTSFDSPSKQRQTQPLQSYNSGLSPGRHTFDANKRFNPKQLTHNDDDINKRIESIRKKYATKALDKSGITLGRTHGQLEGSPLNRTYRDNTNYYTSSPSKVTSVKINSYHDRY